MGGPRRRTTELEGSDPVVRLYRARFLSSSRPGGGRLAVDESSAGSPDSWLGPLSLPDAFFEAAGDVCDELGEPVEEVVVVIVRGQRDATTRTGFVRRSPGSRPAVRRASLAASPPHQERRVAVSVLITDRTRGRPPPGRRHRRRQTRGARHRCGIGRASGSIREPTPVAEDCTFRPIARSLRASSPWSWFAGRRLLAARLRTEPAGHAIACVEVGQPLMCAHSDRSCASDCRSGHGRIRAWVLPGAAS